MDWKGKVSVVLYVVGITAAVFINQYVAAALYVIVAIIWLIPDKRIERLYR